MRPFFDKSLPGIRLYLLATAAAAFLLVPAAIASAAPVQIVFEGAGSGSVTGDEFAPGSPKVECNWNGTASSGVCNSETTAVEGTQTVKVNATAAAGSKFVGWKVESGIVFAPAFCRQIPEAPTASCTVNSFGEEVKIKAVFAKLPNVHVLIEGGGSGTVVGVPNLQGEPPVNCSYASPGPATGACDVLASKSGSITGIMLKQEAAPGSEFGGWTVEKGIVPEPETCEQFGETCGAILLGPVKEIIIKAVFELEPIPTFPLEVTVTGEGEVTSTPAGIECAEADNGTAACEEEFAEGSNVALEAQAAPEWAFSEWTEGPCEGSSSEVCEFAMPAEAEQVAALFVETNEVPLSLIKGGYAQGGTVTSSPAGINCGLACGAQTEEFEEGEVITLTAVAEDGYVFAGWLGCKYISADPEEGECEVTVKGPLTEVTAVFLKDGSQGPPGEDGEDGKDGEQGPPGKDGKDGAQGTPGKDGKDGAQGPAGQNGADGQNGQNGVTGPQGPAGPQGAQGPQGPPGKVTCKVKQKGKKVKVTCTVKAGASSSRAGWRLMRGGVTYSHGATKDGRLQLDLSNLREGRYVLRIEGQRRGTRIAVR